jgi:hypothetical protein
MLNIDHLPKAIRYLASLFASKNQNQFADGKDSCGNTSSLIEERASRTNPRLFAAGPFIQHSVLEKVFLVFSILFIHPVFSTVLAAPFQQSTDPTQPISIEVEHYHANAAQGQYEWVAADQAGFSGDGVMQALPEQGARITQDYVTKSPRLDYRVNFNHAGTYYVWLRAFATSSNSNSVHVGLDGQNVSTAENIYIPVTGDYVWTRGLVKSIVVSTPGEHVLNIWMRESGTIIDKLVLSQTSGFTPADKGPDETPKANAEEQSSGDGSDPEGNDTGELSSKQVILSWDPSPVSVVGYIVYNGATADTASQEAAVLSVDLGTIDALNPKWLCDLRNDLGVLPGEQVCFRVKAYDGSQLSDYSEAVCTIH